jgi:hypothetical protein
MNDLRMSTMLRRSILSGLMLSAALFLPGIGHAAATLARGAGPASLAEPGTTHPGVVTESCESHSPGRHHGGPTRLGDRECCKTPVCGCGCLYSLVGAAVAALSDALRHIATCAEQA